jgi:hypothetical protein
VNRILLVLALSGVVPVVAQTASPNLEITIAADVSELPTTCNVPIRITYKNLTDKQIDVPIAVQEVRDITDVLEVRGPDGKVIRPYFGPHPASSKIGWENMSLNAGEARGFSAVLYASDYGFVKPGDYTVQLRRGSDDGGIPVTYSNILTIRVVGWDTYANQEKSRPLKIIISTDSARILTGSAVTIHTTFLNLTDREVTGGASDIGNLDAVDQFDLHGSDGNAIPPYEGPYPELRSGKPGWIFLRPRGSFHLEMQLDCNIYACKTPGAYRLKVCRGRYQTNTPTVCSNEIGFEVIDKRPEVPQ